MDGQDICRSSAQHSLSLLTDFQQLAGELVHRHKGRLTQLNPLAADIQQRSGRPHIYGNISFKEQHILYLGIYHSQNFTDLIPAARHGGAYDAVCAGKPQSPRAF